MKKPILLFAVSLISLVFAAGAVPAHAAAVTISQTNETGISAQSTMILKQSLTILENLLRQLDAQVKAHEVQNSANMSLTLATIHVRLLEIQISARAGGIPSLALRAPAEKTTMAQPAPASAPTPQQPLAVQIPKTTIPAPIVLEIPLEEKLIETAASEIGADDVPASNAAAVGWFANRKNLLWPSITLIAVLALIFFFRMREKNEELPSANARNNAGNKPHSEEGSPIVY